MKLEDTMLPNMTIVDPGTFRKVFFSPGRSVRRKTCLKLEHSV